MKQLTVFQVANLGKTIMIRKIIADERTIILKKNISKLGNFVEMKFHIHEKPTLKHV